MNNKYLSIFLFSKKVIILLLLLFIVKVNLLAQYSKVHYLPPTYNQSSALQFSSISLSTLEETPFNVVINNADGSYNQTVTGLSKNNPITIELPKGGSLDGIFLASDNKTNKVLKNEGFTLSASKFFFVNQIHSVSNQAEIIASKGSVGAGTEFYSGHLFSKSGSNSSRAHFISVIATEDNTSVTFDNPRVAWEGQTKNFTVILNKGESYVIAAPFNYINGITSSTDKWNDFNGTHVTSTKPIVMNSGSFLGANTSSGLQDAGLDQIVPVKQLNNEFILVKGQGNDPEMETALVVATENNTKVYVNGSSSPAVTLNKGEYTLIKGDKYVNNTMHLKMSSPSLVYQNLSGNGAFSGMGMVFVPGLKEDASKSVFISGVNSIGQSSIYIIAKKGEKVSINGKLLTTAGVENPGNSNWVSYRLSPSDINASFCTSGKTCANQGSNASFLIESSGPINAAVSIVSGAVGAAGYFSGFASVSTNAGVSEIGVLEYTLDCEKDTVSLLAKGATKYTWTSPSGNISLIKKINDSTYLFDYDQSGDTGPYEYKVQMEATSIFGEKINESVELKINVLFKNSCKQCEKPDLGEIIGAQSICEGANPSEIKNLKEGGATLFEWQFSEDNGANWNVISNANNASYDPPSGLTKTTIYRRRGRKDCTPILWSDWSNSITVTVNPLPVNNLNAINDSICGEGKVTLKVDGLITGTTVDWYSTTSAGTIVTGGSGTSTFITPTINSTTNYYAELRNTTTGCVSNNRVKVSAKVNSIPLNNVEVLNGERCGNGSMELSVKNLPINTTVNWFESVSGGLVINGGEEKQNFTTPVLSINKKYYIEIKNTLSNCINPQRVAVSANVNPILVIDLGKDTSICSGENITFKVAGNYSKYLWSDNTTSSSLTTNQAGKYKLTVTDENGCKTSDSVNLSIYNLPTIDLGKDTAICKGENITFKVAGNYSKYLWSDNTISSTLTTTQAGKYKLTVTDTNGCKTSDSVNLSIYNLPAIDLGKDTAICEGENITFKVAGNYSKYLWSDNSTTSSLTTTQAGKYKLTVTDANGCKTSDSVNLSIYNLPIINLGKDTAICSGENITFKVAGNYSKYLWSDNTTSSSLTTNQVGKYEVTVTDANGCKTSDSVNLSIYNPPVIDLGKDTAICEGENITFKVAGNYSKYLWNDNTTSSTLTTTQAGKYKLTVTNANGCKTSDSVNLSIYNLPIIDLGKDTAICKGENITFKVAGNYSKYLWSDNTTSSTLTTTQAGKYKLTVTDANGCKTSDSVNLSIYNLPIIDLGKDTAICKGENITFKVAGNYSKYLWSDNTTSSSLTTNQAGKYKLTVTDENGCKTSDSVNLSIYNPPVIDLGKDTAICSGENITFKVAGSYSKYLWSDNTTNSSLATNQAGKYKLTVMDANGCKTSDSVNLSIYNLPIIDIGKDTAICKGENITLHAKGDFVQYRWNNNSTSASIVVDKDGEYKVKVSDKNGCEAEDKIKIEVEEMDFKIANEFNICQNESVTLSIQQSKNIHEIIWNDTLKKSTFTTNIHGVHYVKGVSKNGCSVSKTTFLNVIELPSLEIEREINLCNEDNYKIQLNPIDYKIKWEDGSTQNSILIRNPKTIYFNIINEQNKVSCLVKDSIKVNFNFSPTIIEAKDQYFCFDNFDTLFVQIPTNASHYYIGDDNRELFTTRNLPFMQEGQYFIHAYNTPSCESVQEINIYNLCEPIVVIPNAFSPNNDGLNDVFLPRIENVDEYELLIFNRWGDVIFHTNDPSLGWDGTYKNQLVQMDVYVYLIRIKGKKDSHLKFEEYKGLFTVIK